MLAYPVLGNVRELQNLVEAPSVFAEPGHPVPHTELPRRLLRSGVGEASTALATLEAATAAYVARAVAHCGAKPPACSMWTSAWWRSIRKQCQQVQ